MLKSFLQLARFIPSYNITQRIYRTILSLTFSLLQIMTQCVPSWDLDENPAPQPRVALEAHSNSNSLAPHVPMLDYEVTELTWENGQLSMHGLAPPRVSTKPQSTWDKPRVGGTLESIVNQGTILPHCGPIEDFVPWFGHHGHGARVPTASATVSMDAMVPALVRDQPSKHVVNQVQTCVVGSCSGNNAFDKKRDDAAPKRARVSRVPVVPLQREWSSSFSSHQLTLDTCERGVGGFTSTSMGSPENTSSGQQATKTTTTEEHDSVYHTRNKRETRHEESTKKQGGKSTLSTKRSRTAAIHNQSERKRRDKINQRMKTLQKLVPNSSKTDKASMLDEVIEYLKQLQAQVGMMNRMNMSPMMLPLTLQQQLQLSMMAPMGMAGMGLGMGMGLGGVMDLNSIGRPNLTGISPLLHPTAFMPFASWPDRSADHISSQAAMIADPMSAFLASQSQPMTMDAYSKMAALYQQFNQVPQPPASNNK